MTAPDQAARQQAQIKSPSKVTRRLIGQELTNGIAAGIKDKDGYVESVAETQLNGVLYKMSQWLKKNKRTFHKKLKAAGSLSDPAAFEVILFYF